MGQQVGISEEKFQMESSYDRIVNSASHKPPTSKHSIIYGQMNAPMEDHTQADK
jgi:hypothetical protein